MNSLPNAVLLLSALLLASHAYAGLDNDVPSCYAANRLKIAAPVSQTEVFVFIDQTTPLDASLQNSVLENVGRLLKPGNAFVIGTFSSFSQGRYLEVLTAGALEGPIEDTVRDDISVKVLRSFDSCMAGQAAFARKAAAEAIKRAMVGSDSALANSDIMGSLKELSARVKLSRAADRIVFVVSDMLEYSGVSSFYANRNLRVIDAGTELEKARHAQLIGDFGEARVFVLGAGLLQESVGGKHTESGVYRNTKTIALLRQFWDSYFTASHAKLVEFGMPALLSPVR